MVSYNMAFVVDLPNDFRVVLDFSPYRKKSGPSPVSFKNLKNAWRSLGVRSIIKGQGDLLLGRLSPAMGFNEKIKSE